MQALTLVYLLTEDKICLAFKKRGFGAGKYNGYGGKLDAGETITQAAVREVMEESTCLVREQDLTHVAELTFLFPDKTLQVSTFFVTSWQGTPQETEEMSPKWFRYSDIPYKDMWADDVYWIPRALKGEQLVGRITFASDESTITHMEWDVVEEF